MLEKSREPRTLNKIGEMLHSLPIDLLFGMVTVSSIKKIGIKSDKK